MTAVAGDADLVEDVDGAALALARVLHAGGTVWAVGTTWPAGRSVDGEDPVAAVRAGSDAGDAVLLRAPADDPVAADLARRAPAWGVRATWVGSGPRPAGGTADDVLWSDDPAAVLAMLDERAHAHLRRPEHLEVPVEVCVPVDGHCVTCSDEGRLGEVVATPTDLLHPARVRTAAGVEDVDVTLVGEVRPGDLLLVHAGSALTVVPTSGGTP